MQSIIDYAPFWTAYLVFAVIGLWCWHKLFFFLSKGSLLKQIFLVLGAVLLFTPAPSATESAHFAPATFVLLLDVLSGVPVVESKAPIWYALFAVVFLVTIILFRITATGSKEATAERR